MGGFPYLEPWEGIKFPDPEAATDEGIIALGGNLSPGVLLSAYRQGVFPWYNPGEPILWWNPDPRMVLFVDEVHVSRRMRRILRHREFDVTMDSAFKDVVRECGAVPRPGQDGTWVSDEIIDAYHALHMLGHAHSVEVRLDGVLVGGLYGVAIGRVFFGESMFARESNASKYGFIHLAAFLRSWGWPLIDCQIRTDHLESLGGRLIDRTDFMATLNRECVLPGLIGSWEGAFLDFWSGENYPDW